VLIRKEGCQGNFPDAPSPTIKYVDAKIKIDNVWQSGFFSSRPSARSSSLLPVAMFLQSKTDAPKRTRPGLTSRALLQRGDAGDTDLTVTWVDVEPGEAQEPHRHPPEQVYVVTQGEGRMHVGGETESVAAGDLIRIPPGATHFAENTGAEALSYVSAATPSFDVTAQYDRGDSLSVPETARPRSSAEGRPGALRAHLRCQFRYTRHANGQIIEALDALGPEKTPERALRLLAHLLRAQDVWLGRIRGADDPPAIWGEDALAECRTRAEASHAAWLRFLQDSAPRDFEATIRYENSKGVAFENELREIVGHVINHATHHRAQIAALIREAGREPPATGYIFYARAQQAS
jgi:uncharacterized damage-inducible protein DinB/mannose-6-phosphate isomerase-like protein (cupin superfamily)